MRDTFVRGLLTATACTGALVSLSGQTTPPTFRGSTTLVRLDVSVLDNKRKPIAGLTAADFVVLENGKPRPVDTVLEVNVPRPIVPSAPWLNGAPHDVVSNQSIPDAKRVVVIVVNDFSLTFTQGRSFVRDKTLQIAANVIRDLGPQDLSALAFLYSDRVGQGLTVDHRRLLDELNSVNRFARDVTEGKPPADAPTDLQSRQPPIKLDPKVGPCFGPTTMLRRMQETVRALGGMPDMRKTIVYIGRGIDIRPPDTCVLAFATQRLFESAQRANVILQPIDPTGLSTGMTMPQSRTASTLGPALHLDGGQEFLKTLAENTGGRAVINNNDPDREVSRILEKTRSYYLVGFQPALPVTDQKLRKIEVQVRRRGAQVTTRSGIYPNADGDFAPNTTTAASVDATVDSLLPMTGLRLDGSAAIFADANHQGVAILGMTIHQPVAAASSGAASRTQDLQFIARAIDAQGSPVATNRQTLRIALVPEAGSLATYELVTRYPLAPGRYELRMGLLAPNQKAGSVYLDVTVPDFWREPLSLSGVVLKSSRAPKSASAVPLTDVLPLVPTTTRTFAAGDDVSAFLRVYQTGPQLPVTTRTQIIDATGVVYMDTAGAATPAGPTALRSADVSTALPIAKLPKGDYVMQFDATSGETRARQTVRFFVR